MSRFTHTLGEEGKEITAVVEFVPIHVKFKKIMSFIDKTSEEF
jgi:hypothetical protein